VPGACFLGSSNLLNIALAFGLSIFVLVYAAASFSGALGVLHAMQVCGSERRKRTEHS
jgi:hypothetical protein